MRRSLLVAAGCFLAGTILSSASAETPAERFARARQAADAQDWTRAVDVSDALVGAHPAVFDYGLFHARVLGWADRNAESAAAFERLYRWHPHRLARYGGEWARQLLWSGQAERALDVHRLLAVLSLADDALLEERARAYAWKGDAAHAASLYGVLHARRPEDRDVRLAYAQNLAWSGRDADAIRVLRAGLAGAEGTAEEHLWLSRLARWNGRPLAARRHAERGLAVANAEARPALVLAHAEALAALGNASAAHAMTETLAPSDASRGFRDRLTRGVGRPWVSALGATSDDSDDLDIRNLELAASWAVTLDGALGASLREDELTSAAGDRTIRRIGVLGAWSGTRWSARWHVRQGALKDGDFDPTTGGVSAGYVASDVLRVDVSLERTDYESILAIDREVVGQFGTLSGTFRWSPAWRTSVGGGVGLVDGPAPVVRNERVHGHADVAVRVLRRPRLALSSGLYAFRFSERAGDGYWSPEDFWSWSLGADLNPSFPALRAELVLAGGFAVQRETPGETTTAGRFTGRVLVRPTPPVRLEYRFETSDSKVSSDRGFARTRHALLLTGTF